MQTAAVAYLLLYNAMVVVPLVSILAITYIGMQSQTLGRLLQERLALVKLSLSGLFVFLGVLLIMTT